MWGGGKALSVIVITPRKKRERETIDQRPRREGGGGKSRNIHRRFQTIKVWKLPVCLQIGTRGIRIDPKSVLQRAKGKQVKWWRISALLFRDIALLALHAVMLIKRLLRAHALLLFILRNTPIIGRRVALLGMYAQRIAVCVSDGGRQTPTVSRRKMP